MRHSLLHEYEEPVSWQGRTLVVSGPDDDMIAP